MYKKTLATALLICTIPAMANAAWFLTTQARNAGGTLDSSNKTGQVVTDGALTKGYSVITEQSPVATAGPGNSVKSVVITDSYVNASGFLAKDVITAPFTPVDNHTYSVAATFQASSFAVKATFAGGTVTPSSIGNVVYGYTLAKDLVFTFTPKYGYSITGITGAPAEATVVTPGTVNAKATVTFPAGYSFTGAVNLAATAVQTAPGVDPILPQTVVFGKTGVKLQAVPKNLTSPTYSWTYVSGPANTSAVVNTNGKIETVVTPGPALTLNNPTAALATFDAPSVAGQYKFRCTVSSQGNPDITTMATVNVVSSSADAAGQCQFCHTANGVAGSTPTSNFGLDWAASVHSGSTSSTCSGCHYGTANGGHPGTVTKANINSTTFAVTAAQVTGGKGNVVTQGNVFCSSCHTVPHQTNNFANGYACVTCHTSTTGQGGTGDAHKIQATSCKGCHSIGQSNPFTDKTLVNDNNGVRAVTGEFSKWSHHIVNPNGMEPLDEQCAICHLEGNVGTYGFEVAGGKHMVDNKIHLRDTTDNTDADFAWDPANPDHSGMDRFCMSCHDDNGVVSPTVTKLQALITPETGIAATASNPFGDTLSNRYDKMKRPAVVDAKGQFDTANPSHHAVRGQKYTGRTRTAGPRQIANEAAFAANSSAALPGVRSTIYDSRAIRTTAGTGHNAPYNVSKFVETYETLSPAPNTNDKTLGDDSVLHCGDCHTVGQYRAADVNVLPKNAAVIGAHGSNNEYMLRNSLGTDERHVGQTYSSAAGVNYFTNPDTQPWLVCFNCHSYQNYGSIGNATNLTGTNHAGEYANSNRCNGPVNTISFVGYTTSLNDEQEPYAFRLGLGQRDGITTGSTATSDTDFSNLFGIQCANCHNAGPNNAFGGIHGAKVQTYQDANGAAQKAYRFLPGLGNTMFVPGSAAGVGTVSDLNWEVKLAGTKYDAGKTTVTDNSGCYTIVPEGADGASNASFDISPTAGQKAYDGTTEIFGTWGGCDDHRGNAHGKAFANPVAPYDGGTVPTGGAGAVRKVLRPVTY